MLCQEHRSSKEVRCRPGKSLTIDGVKKFVPSCRRSILQVFDYTVKPLHEQLKEYTPALQYAYIIDAVGTWDLWKHCEAYLVPGGTYVALAMRATGPGDIMCELSSVASAYVRPKWLGGVNRKFTFVIALLHILSREARSLNMQFYRLCMGKHNTTERMQALSKFAELSASDSLVI